MQMVLCAECNIPINALEPPDRLQGKVLRHLAEKAGDPDLAAAEWMATTAPLGIVHPIEPGGAFPTITAEEAAHNVSRYAQPELHLAAAGNYKSYEEAQGLADQEIQKELEKYFLQVKATRQELAAELGRLYPSRVGVIVKEAVERIKVKLIHDLSRGGGSPESEATRKSRPPPAH